MKKQITVLCAALLCLLAAFAPGAAAAPALTTTEAYCIIDADTGLAERSKGGVPPLWVYQFLCRLCAIFARRG